MRFILDALIEWLQIVFMLFFVVSAAATAVAMIFFFARFIFNIAGIQLWPFN